MREKRLERRGWGKGGMRRGKKEEVGEKEGGVEKKIWEKEGKWKRKKGKRRKEGRNGIGVKLTDMEGG